jgi:signal transduction histidine kinase
MGRPVRLPRPGHHIGPVPVVDGVLALALCIFAAGGLLGGQVHEHPLAITVPIAVASTAVVAVRRRFPLVMAAVVSVLAVAQALFADHASSTLWALVVFLVAAYTTAAECDEGPALIGLGLVVGGQFLCEWLDKGSDYPFDALVFGGVWLFGRGTRSWRNQADHAEQHRHDLARIAVAQERARIARELHDVVAHSLSVIAVQADAAEAALLKEPSRAVAPMHAIRDSARDALSDMRQLLHVLRAQEEPDPGEDGAESRARADLTPARGLDDLPQLIATMREAGLRLETEVAAIGPLSQGTELTVFRIAQEGLTNVRKHAGDVPTRLRITRDAGEITIEIDNEPSPDGRSGDHEELSTGHGLLGVRERVQAAGGSLRAGGTESGGYRLSASLPATGQEVRLR